MFCGPGVQVATMPDGNDHTTARAARAKALKARMRLPVYLNRFLGWRGYFRYGNGRGERSRRGNPRVSAKTSDYRRPRETFEATLDAVRGLICFRETIPP